LNSLIECLSIFAGGDDHRKREKKKSLLFISYVDEELKFSSTGEGEFQEVEFFPTLYIPDEINDSFKFESSEIIAKLIMDSAFLRDAFQEFDSSCKEVTFCISPIEPYFKISSSVGIIGEVNVEYAKESDIIEYFMCQNNLIRFTYSVDLLSSFISALSLSSKTSIRVNSLGIICLQLMIQRTTHHIEDEIAYVEFTCLPRSL
jgi:cell cycle checkpoint protein